MTKAGATTGKAVFNLDRIFGLTLRAAGQGKAGFIRLALWAFFVYGALAVLAGLVLPADQDPEKVAPAVAGVAILIGLAYIAVSLLIHLTAIGLASAALQDQPQPLGTVFRHVLRRFWPALGSAILATIGIVAGLLLLIVPGVILAVRWWLWSPASMLDGSGPAGALRRSADLTRGRRWVIFFVLLIGFLVGGALNQLTATLAFMHDAFIVVSIAVYCLVALFWACVTAAMHHVLRQSEPAAGS